VGASEGGTRFDDPPNRQRRKQVLADEGSRKSRGNLNNEEEKKKNPRATKRIPRAEENGGRRGEDGKKPIVEVYLKRWEKREFWFGSDDEVTSSFKDGTLLGNKSRGYGKPCRDR